MLAGKPSPAEQTSCVVAPRNSIRFELFVKREPHAFLRSVVALLLIAGTLWAAQWQFHRGVARSERNAVIESHISLPTISLNEALARIDQSEWRTIRTTGSFDGESNILLRNHYFEGKYGFEVLTLFTPLQGESFWVDRGWVIAGATAMDKPKLPPLPVGQVEIVGRLRLNTSLPQGTIFATGSASDSPLLREVNAQRQISNQLFYVDLISGNRAELTPQIPAQLPELSDGPHMAYAAQWVIFAGLIGYGRLLMRKTDLGEHTNQSRDHQD